jgi:hypothetical protein
VPGADGKSVASRLHTLSLVLLLGALAAPAAAHASLRVGVQDDALLTSAEPNAGPLAASLAPAVIRYNVPWNLVAQRRPQRPDDMTDPGYDWSQSDLLVGRATSIGAAPILTIVGSPAWANGGRRSTWAPTSAAEYGRFCRLVATRYSGSYTPPGAEQPLPRVTSFTVWNEVNRGQYFMPQGAPAPRRYAALYRACASGIHAADPAAVAAFGPLASRSAQGGLAPLDFLRAYRRAAGPRPQAVAINPYLENLLPAYRPHELRASGAITIRNLDVLQRALRAAYHRTLPIWITEFAIRSAPQPGLGVITPQRQAVLARQSIEIVRRHYPYVPYLVWFLLRDEGAASYWRSGMVTFGWARKPLFDVIRSYDSRAGRLPGVVTTW